MAAVYGRIARTPLIPTQGGGSGTSEPYAPGTGTADAYERDSPNESTTKLPLVLGFLGTSLASGRIFDDKVSIHEDFRFSGHKNGHAWRSKTERYLITKVPALSQILRWERLVHLRQGWERDRPHRSPEHGPLGIPRQLYHR